MREQTEERTPLTTLLESEEPKSVNTYREASCEFYRILTESVTYILKQKNKTLATLGVAYALEVGEITEISMRERCEAMGYSHNAVSRHCAAFKMIAKI